MERPWPLRLGAFYLFFMMAIYKKKWVYKDAIIWFRCLGNWQWIDSAVKAIED